MGKTKQNKLTQSQSSVQHNNALELFKARARTRLQNWKNRQGLLKASASATGAAPGPAKLSRKEYKQLKRANRNAIARPNLHTHATNRKVNPVQCDNNDSSDSDIEIIEQESVVVVLDDESEDDDHGTNDETACEKDADIPPEIEAKESVDIAEKICPPSVTNVGVDAFVEDTNSTEPPPPGTEDYVNVDESVKAVDNQQLNDSIFSIESADLDETIEFNYVPDESDQPAEATPRPMCTTPEIRIDNMMQNLSPITPVTKDASISIIAAQVTPTSTTPANVSWADLFKDQPSSSPIPLMFFDDKQGSVDNPVIAHVPLYEAISDNSFICEQSFGSALPNVRVAQPKANGDSALASTSKSAIEIINLANTTASPAIPRNVRKRKHKLSASKLAQNNGEDADDSVVFVSETPSSPSASHKRAVANFISIANQRSANFNSRLPKNARLQPKTLAKRVFQRALANQRQPPPAPVVTNNSYNPSQSKVDMTKSAKRMVVIDGSNVAFGHSTNHTFSVRGLAICIEFFEREGHLVKAVLPQMRLKQTQSSDPVLLEKLHEQGKVVLTPCKNLPGRNATSYDDRFILDLAIEFDAAVISNDNYRDLFMEDESKYRPIIESRVVGYTWCMDMIMFPKDPYGRGGPTLDEILNRKV